MYRLLLLLPVLFALGCATELTPEGSTVGIVTDKENCESLGTVSAANSMAMSSADDAEGAMNALRNKAAGMGANAVRIISVDTDVGVTTALAEALVCDSE